jgi:hypothetical protein
MVKPWRDAGHTVMTVDIKDTDRPSHLALDVTEQHKLNYLIEWDADIIFSFPPCTDLAVSGAAHFEKKRKENPYCQYDAMSLFKVADYIAIKNNTPYMIENPVSVASTLWRKPDCGYFHPYEYGGYLPEDDVHPLYPDYIAPRDAYPKKTGIWSGNGFIMPEKKPVPCPPGYSAQHKKLGGKSERTKTIRSMTPRGFAQAVFEANERIVQ